jgi:hypothetical protein
MLSARIKWLDEIVCWNGVESIPRYTAIWRFVSRGLHPFLIENGYRVLGDVKALTLGISHLLFVNRGRSCLDSQIPSISYEEEADNKAHYYHVLSETKWDIFWDAWTLWSDLTSERGQDRQIDIQEFVWSQLNLDESPQTRVVDELLASFEEVGTTTKEDVYLREAAESNEWGGFR